MSSAPSSSSTLHSHGLKLLAMLALCMTLSACDYFQKPPKATQTPEEAKAEGVALGAACRQVGHSLENCYERNPNSQKEGIFTGWKEMNEYMAAKNLPTLESSSSRNSARREREKMEKEKDKDTNKDAKNPDNKSDSRNSKGNRNSKGDSESGKENHNNVSSKK